MNWLKSSKALCVIASAVLASLVKESLIPHEWIEVASWLSGALLALPARLDSLFGFVTIHHTSLAPPQPLPPPSRVPREYVVPQDNEDDNER